MDKLSTLIKTGNLPEITQQRSNLPEKSRKKVETLLALCTNPADFIIKFNPDFCADRYRQFNKTETALLSGMIKLSDLQFAYDEDTAIDLLRAWLLNFSVYLGLDTEIQVVKTIARELYSEIFMLNMAELTLFFSRLRKGYYGSFYGRFDGMMICSAAREYRQQRGHILAKLPEEEQNRLV